MTEFEKAVVEEVKRVRTLLSQNDNLTQFTFSITAQGRVHSGEVQISFGMGDYSASVTGNSVDGVVYEHLRRTGWLHANNPLMLTAVGTVDDDCPF